MLVLSGPPSCASISAPSLGNDGEPLRIMGGILGESWRLHNVAVGVFMGEIWKRRRGTKEGWAAVLNRFSRLKGIFALYCPFSQRVCRGHGELMGEWWANSRVSCGGRVVLWIYGRVKQRFMWRNGGFLEDPPPPPSVHCVGPLELMMMMWTIPSISPP